MKRIEKTSFQLSEEIQRSAITIPLFVRVIVCKIYFVIGALGGELELRCEPARSDKHPIFAEKYDVSTYRMGRGGRDMDQEL